MHNRSETLDHIILESLNYPYAIDIFFKLIQKHPKQQSNRNILKTSDISTYMEIAIFLGLT